MKHSIAIIGVGAVGSAIANTLIANNTAAELILLDINKERCAGEVQDLSDALGSSLTSRVKQGTYEEVKQAHIILMCAGKPQKPGQDRLELMRTNKKILDDVLGNLTGLRKDAIVIIVANPLDILTFCTLKQLDLPRKQVFGTGTLLDSVRLQGILSERLNIADQSIEAWVLGEHGDSQVVAWSATRIAGNPVDHYGITPVDQAACAEEVKQAAYEIIEAKGATYYGIAAVVVQLCEIILYDKRQIVPISWYHEEYGVCMSLPILLTQNGVERITPFAYSKKEREALEKSAELLRSYQKKI